MDKKAEGLRKYLKKHKIGLRGRIVLPEEIGRLDKLALKQLDRSEAKIIVEPFPLEEKKKGK